jgi:hypothetical protein
MEKERVTPQMHVRTQVRSGAGGGYVNGVWYPDMSGVCSGAPAPTPVPPQPTPVPPYQGGGYVNGVWYPDKSGIC